jgi:MAE_28990/MAE_18760-like HEPN
MFSNLTDQLRARIAAIESVLVTNERLRELVFEDSAPAQVQDVAIPARALSDECAKQLRALVLGDGPRKLDWRIYDHCAAFTRLYAVYEQFVNDLLSGYVSLLPRLYESYAELPEVVSINHRIGLGQILIKIGNKKQYKRMEEAAVIRALSSGFSGEASYSLAPEAFTADRQNYKFNVLVEIFSHIGIENCGQRIIHHPTVADFMSATMGESDTVQGELDKFVDYRNEAAHSTVDNIVAVEEIRNIGRFLLALSDALSQIVELTVIERRTVQGKWVSLGTVSEAYQGGSVVVAKMSKCRVVKGETLILRGPGPRSHLKVEVLSIRVENVDHDKVDVEDGQELGMGLSVRAKLGAQLLRLVPLEEQKPAENQPSSESATVEVEQVEVLAEPDAEPNMADPDAIGA